LLIDWELSKDCDQIGKEARQPERTVHFVFVQWRSRSLTLSYF
jgi:hypothetical protein